MSHARLVDFPACTIHIAIQTRLNGPLKRLIIDAARSPVRFNRQLPALEAREIGFRRRGEGKKGRERREKNTSEVHDVGVDGDVRLHRARFIARDLLISTGEAGPRRRHRPRSRDQLPIGGSRASIHGGREYSLLFFFFFSITLFFSPSSRAASETIGVAARYFYASFSNVAPRGRSALLGWRAAASRVSRWTRNPPPRRRRRSRPNLAECRAVRKHGMIARVPPSRSAPRITNDLDSAPALRSFSLPSPSPRSSTRAHTRRRRTNETHEPSADGR